MPLTAFASDDVHPYTRTAIAAVARFGFPQTDVKMALRMDAGGLHGKKQQAGKKIEIMLRVRIGWVGSIALTVLSLPTLVGRTHELEKGIKRIVAPIDQSLAYLLGAGSTAAADDLDVLLGVGDDVRVV